MAIKKAKWRQQEILTLFVCLLSKKELHLQFEGQGYLRSQVEVKTGTQHTLFCSLSPPPRIQEPSYTGWSVQTGLGGSIDAPPTGPEGHLVWSACPQGPRSPAALSKEIEVALT